MIATWNPVKFKKNNVVVEIGDGLNTFNPPLDIADSQATDMRNLVSTNYPALKVRNGKTQISTTLTIPNALGQRNNEYLHVVDGTTWKYWNGSTYVNVATGLTSSLGEFEEFSTGTTKYTIFSNGTDRKAWDGSSITNLTNAPLSKIFTTHKGRIYFARDNDIVFSALNLINDYSTPNDAGTIDVTRAKGVLTSLYEYNNKVIVFTEFGMHELYGTGPSNYELVDIEGDIGCVSDKSVTIANKRLYWVWHNGVYEYAGGTIIKVSEPYADNGVNGGVTSFIRGINFDYKDNIVSGSLGDYLYVSIPYNSNENNVTLVFDTKLRKWYARDEGYLNFVTIGDVLYGIDVSGNLWDMSTTATQDGSSDISWYWISKAYNEGTPSSRTTISEFWLTYYLPVGSTMKLAYSTDMDGTSFTDLYTFTPSVNKQSTRIIVPVSSLQNTDWYRLKLYGTGDCTVYFLEKKGRVKYNER